MRCCWVDTVASKRPLKSNHPAIQTRLSRHNWRLIVLLCSLQQQTSPHSHRLASDKQRLGDGGDNNEVTQQWPLRSLYTFVRQVELWQILSSTRSSPSNCREWRSPIGPNHFSPQRRLGAQHWSRKRRTLKTKRHWTNSTELFSDNKNTFGSSFLSKIVVKILRK